MRVSIYRRENECVCVSMHIGENESVSMYACMCQPSLPMLLKIAMKI